MSFFDAVEFCIAGGGRLYEPRDVHQRWEVLGKTREAGLVYGFWIGISDEDEEEL